MKQLTIRDIARLSGVSRSTVSLVLNHSPQSRGITEAVYNRYAYDKEKRAALLQWEIELLQLIQARARPERSAGT